MTGAISRENARTDRRNGRKEERACITGVSWTGAVFEIETETWLIIAAPNRIDDRREPRFPPPGAAVFSDS
jgi:hypothetical protein